MPSASCSRSFLNGHPGRELATPHYQSFEINDLTTGALVYRWVEQEGDVPAVIVLRDRPERRP